MTLLLSLQRGLAEFEQLLIGRAPKDGLVITPRVCGICGTAHLYTAALALERLAGLPVTPHATLVRNLCLMAENVQSDLRQSFLFFTPDFCNAIYAAHPLAAELNAAFTPLKGSVVRGTLKDIKRKCQDEKIASQAMIVASPTLGAADWPDLIRSKLYDPTFGHRFRKASAQENAA